MAIQNGLFADRVPKVMGLGAGWVSPITTPRFLAVDGSADGVVEQIVASVDGINWTFYSTPAEFQELRMACRGANCWIAVSETWGNTTGAIIRTTNLTTWEVVTHPGLQITTWSTAHGNGTFVIGGTDETHAVGKFIYSGDDGETWVRVARDDNRGNVMIAYDGSYFVAVTPSSVSVLGSDLVIPMGEEVASSVQISSDGITWATATTPGTLQNVTTTSGAAGNWIRMRYLLDGKLWLCGYEPAHGATVLNCIFAYSTDHGATWTQVSTGLAHMGMDIATDGSGHYVACGRDTAVMVSSNGTSWSTVELGQDTWWFSVAYHDGRFVAVGYDQGTSGYTNKTIAYSDDNAATWTQAVNPLGPPANAYGPGITRFQDIEFG